MLQILAPITGNVWQVLVGEGDQVRAGDVVAIIESMKLEIPVEADGAGRIAQVLVDVGDSVGEDDPMFVLD